MTATQLLVVPRSIPMIFAMNGLLYGTPRAWIVRRVWITLGKHCAMTVWAGGAVKREISRSYRKRGCAGVLCRMPIPHGAYKDLPDWQPAFPVSPQREAERFFRESKSAPLRVAAK